MSLTLTLCIFFCTQNMLRKACDRLPIYKIGNHARHHRNERYIGSLSISHKRSLSVLQEGHSSSVWILVFTDDWQWAHMSVRVLFLRCKYEVKHPCPVKSCVKWKVKLPCLLAIYLPNTGTTVSLVIFPIALGCWRRLSHFQLSLIQRAGLAPQLPVNFGPFSRKKLDR